MSKIWRVEEEQIMKAGKIVGINYSVWYKNESGERTARKNYRHGHYKVIPMTVLNFILDESNEAITKYQEFDGNTYKRTMYQEEKKMGNINMTTAQEDIEDAIKFGWIEAQEATSTNENESEEETTMKNTKSMTKSEAIREIATLSSSTLARICGSTNYSIIDDCSSKLILAASSMAENAFEGCENWMDVLNRINTSKGNDVDNYYILGSMDYREYITKYGYDKAVTILNDYIEIILEGSAETKAERDYIRGAKDALCIA